MSTTLTIRLNEDLASWLNDEASKTGAPRGRIVKSALEKARQAADQPFMRLAGSIDGAPDLSQRKGFSRK